MLIINVGINIDKNRIKWIYYTLTLTLTAFVRKIHIPKGNKETVSIIILL